MQAILEDSLGFQRRITVKPPFPPIIRLPVLVGPGVARCFFRMLQSPNLVYRERIAVGEFQPLELDDL